MDADAAVDVYGEILELPPAASVKVESRSVHAYGIDEAPQLRPDTDRRYAYDVPHDPAHDLRILLQHPTCDTKTHFFDTTAKFGIDFPKDFIRQVSELALDLLPGVTTCRLNYIDDEGDACALSENSLATALCFAKPLKIGEDFAILEVAISAPKIGF